MWDNRLAALARAYPSAILSIVEPSGYPISVRCTVTLDDAAAVVRFPALPPLAAGWRGRACVLFHRHNEKLEGLHQMVIRGELAEDGGALVLRGGEFVLANGRQDTDEMPHAGRPLHMFQFLLLGRSKAREYLAKRGTPWPPIPFDEIGRAVYDDST